VLVVYDSPSDDTVPVARALAHGGAPIRLLRSRGVGFPAAMLTGLGEAGTGPALVTMADLSDDLEALGRMLAAFAAGADVVVGSRFMAGGRVVRGHPLKAFLSRWGSQILARCAGFPTHDASNAFRLYDAELVRRLVVPEANGFEAVFGVLLAAWEAGARIEEVPVTWSGRTRGTSHFKLRWLAGYGRLWLRALRHGAALEDRARRLRGGGR
jgi:NAD(P)-dependent dehydrogenase (short-subunit alcohol dehydrogenase family)